MPKKRKFSHGGIQYLSIADVCDTMGFSYSWIIKLVERGNLKGIKVGQQWFFHPETVQSYFIKTTSEATLSDEDLLSGV